MSADSQGERERRHHGVSGLQQSERDRLAAFQHGMQQQQEELVSPQRQRMRLQQQQQFSLQQALNELHQITRRLDPSLMYQGGGRKSPSVKEMLMAAAYNLPYYPISLVKTLIQLGYEPVPPKPLFSWIFRRYFYYYPGLIGYTRALVRQGGWLSLYHGWGHFFMASFVNISANSFIRPIVNWQVNAVICRVTEQHGDVPDTDPPDSMRSILIRGTRMFCTSMVTGLCVQVIMQPFKVIAVRCVAQTIGGETEYNSVWSSIKHIYHTEGIKGFFVGLVPALLGHACSVFIHSTLWFFMEVIAASIPNQLGKIAVKFVSMPILALMPSSYAYPLYHVSTLMSVNNVGLAAGQPPRMPVYTNWRDCFIHLRATGNLYRGSAILFSRFAYDYQNS